RRISLSVTTTTSPDTSPLSLHDALPIYPDRGAGEARSRAEGDAGPRDRIPGRPGPRAWNRGRSRAPARVRLGRLPGDQLAEHGGERQSTRLNSSHQIISYAVFCLRTKRA